MENKAAKTALGPIFQVALEQLIPEQQRVVRDGTAYQFLPAYLKGLVNLCRIGFVRRALFNLADRIVPGIRGGILCRKRYITDILTAALNEEIQSVVILGAGFDSLSYRIPDSASPQIYEVDLPQIIQAKKAKLQQLPERVPAHVKLVSIDFNNEDLGGVLQHAGYAGKEPAFFVWEGVTQYISETAVQKVFEYLRKAPPESQLVFTYVRKDFIEGKQMYGLDVLYRQTREVKQLWQFGLDPEAIEAFLRQYSWKLLEQVGSAEYHKRYIEPVNRALPVMEVEIAVHAQRGGN